MQATRKDKAPPADTQLFIAAGVILQFLVSPDEVGDAACIIRGTIPPGVVVPLHSHAEPEILYVLEGSLEIYRANQAGNAWTVAAVGDVVTIRGGVKHALCNRSSLPVTLVVVAKSELFKFFRQLAKPFDPKQNPAPPTPQAMQELLAIAAKYGYWLASPEENAAIGLSAL